MKLPEELKALCLKDLEVGKKVFTVPWAVWVDSDQELHLDTTFTYYTEPGGSVELAVTRTPYGWVVGLLSGATYRYSISYKREPYLWDEEVVDFFQGGK